MRTAREADLLATLERADIQRVLDDVVRPGAVRMHACRCVCRCACMCACMCACACACACACVRACLVVATSYGIHTSMFTILYPTCWVFSACVPPSSPRGALTNIQLQTGGKGRRVLTTQVASTLNSSSSSSSASASSTTSTEAASGSGRGEQSGSDNYSANDRANIVIRSAKEFAAGNSVFPPFVGDPGPLIQI
jgi:hypothetical protein